MSHEISIDEAWRIHHEHSASRLTEPERWASRTPALKKTIECELHNLESLMGLTCSPIEELFAAALWAAHIFPNKEARSNHGEVVALQVDLSDESKLLVMPQTCVGPYSVDFFLELKYQKQRAFVAVELDGHEFHEKTKTQAAHDKKRDRILVAMGLTIVRFTGSEVTRNAAACVDEVAAILGRNLREVPS